MASLLRVNEWETYLIEADRLEEAGKVREARVLRRRGEVLRVMGEAAKVGTVRGKYDLPCGVVLTAKRRPRSVWCFLKWPPYGDGHAFMLTTRLVGQRGYLARRVRGLFEVRGLAELWKGK
jgi:hypothetical protein